MLEEINTACCQLRFEIILIVENQQQKNNKNNQTFNIHFDLVNGSYDTFSLQKYLALIKRNKIANMFNIGLLNR
jgi:hypothetical protein